MNALNRKLDEARDKFLEAMYDAKTVTGEAMDELLEMKRQDRIRARYARLYAYRLQKAIENLGRAPSLAVSSEKETGEFGEGQSGYLHQNTTKDGGISDEASSGARLTSFDVFDENDGESESERRMWAARDAYDMRDGK